MNGAKLQRPVGRSMGGPLFIRHPEPGDYDGAELVAELASGAEEPDRSAREWTVGPPGDDRKNAPGWQWQDDQAATEH